MNTERDDNPQDPEADTGDAEGQASAASSGGVAPTADDPTSTDSATTNSSDETAPDAESTETGKAGAAADEDELLLSDELTPELVEEEALRGDFVLRWAVVLLALLFGCTEIAESQSLVRIRTGQYIASHGWWPPANDVFSATAEVEPRRWINPAWLFDLLLAGVHAVGGPVGLTLFKAVMACALFGLLVHSGIPTISTWWGSIAAALALLACYRQITALPEMVTLLGLGVMLWLLARWKQTGDVRIVGALVVLLALWSNLDPRAFMGWAALVLYAGGEALGAVLGRPGLEEPRQRRLLAGVVGLGALVMMIHPVGWRVWLSPYRLFAVEYPAWQQYEEWSYTPLTEAEFWQRITPDAAAALLLAFAAAITFLFNRRRVDAGEIALWAGAVVAALLGSHELASLAVVSAWLANRNAQAWYRDSFRQTYSVETSELLFTRGGRAATVLAMAALAFLELGGWLEGPDGRRVGLGWQPQLASLMESLGEALEGALDERAFNFRLSQGDVLIWLGHKPFVDSRVALFHGEGEDDWLGLHQRVRLALRRPRPGVPIPGTGDVRTWQEAFDRFGINHVIPRLSGRVPDYETYVDLLTAPQWELNRLTAATAVFYRADRLEQSPELATFLEQNRLNLRDLVFRKDSPAVEPRGVWARPRSFYERMLSVPRYIVPNPIQLARHYQRTQAAAAAEAWPVLAYLAIRHANEGLAIDPNCAEGFRVLAGAYDMLRTAEAMAAGGAARTGLDRMRYYQILSASHQALTIEPDDPDRWYLLWRVYAQMGRADLALHALDRCLELLPESAKLPPEETRLRDSFRSTVEQVTENVNRGLETGGNRLQIAQFAVNSGCLRLALEVLEGDRVLLAQNPAAQRLQLILLMETGRSEEAFEVSVQLEQFADQVGLADWRTLAAWAALGNAQYDRAIRLLRAEIAELERSRLAGLMQSLPFVQPPAPLIRPGQSFWPIQQTAAARSVLYDFPFRKAQLLLQIAACELESGASKRAAATWRRVLEVEPETPARRLVAYYLVQATDEPIDPEPPSARIPFEHRDDVFTPESAD